MQTKVREIDNSSSNRPLGEIYQDFYALGIFVLNANGTIRYCNEILLRKIGATLEQSCGKSIRTFIPDFPGDADVPDLGAALAATAAAAKLTQLRSLEGGVVMVRFTARPLLPKGRSSLVVVIEDIDQKENAVSKRDIGSLIANSEASIDAIAITDCHGEIRFVNTAFEWMTGYARAELIGERLQDLQLGLSETDRNPNFWADIKEGKSFSGVCVHRRKDGVRFHHEQSVRPFYDMSGVVTHAVFTGHDVSQRIIAAQRIAHQANYDSLTGLPNRNLLSDRLQQALKGATRCHEGFAIAMLDVDQFKAVNDCYGHAVGDLVLCEVTRRVGGCIRDEDTFGRLGGDEFTLIFPGIHRREDAEDVVNKISEAFFDGLIIRDKVLRISVSIGVAIYPQDGEDLQNLLEYADTQMYRAKARLSVQSSLGLLG